MLWNNLPKGRNGAEIIVKFTFNKPEGIVLASKTFKEVVQTFLFSIKETDFNPAINPVNWRFKEGKSGFLKNTPKLTAVFD